jgi:ABC-type sulfate transport system permease component
MKNIKAKQKNRGWYIWTYWNSLVMLKILVVWFLRYLVFSLFKDSLKNMIKVFNNRYSRNIMVKLQTK